MRRFPGRELATAWAGFAGWLALAVAGCGGSGKPAAPAGPAFGGVKLVVAAVGEPALLATVAAQRGEWEASRGASTTLKERPVEPRATGDAHLLVFPGDRLGDLLDAGALLPIPESTLRPPPPAAETEASATPEQAPDDAEDSADALQFADVLPAYRDQVSRWGSDRVALPYGGTALVLVSNRAAFDSETARVAARAAGLTLQAPQTWEQFDALARFFHGRDWDGDGTPDFGIAVPLGPDPEGVGDTAFLARAASLGQHRDHYSLLFDSDTLAPRVTSPPFVEALRGLVSWKACSPPGSETFDAAKAREAFRKGNVAFLIDRAERADQWGGDKARAIGVAPLPGSGRVFEPLRQVWENLPAASPNRPSYLPTGGGWLVGVSSHAKGKEREAALDLARYLLSPETSNRVRSDRAFPMLPVRSSQVGQGLPDPRSAPGVESRPWSDAVNRTLVAPRVVPGLRIPEAPAYLADLARGRVAAITGSATPEAALAEVAAAWSARSKSLGTARQLWHYRRSLNSLVTSPTAPPADH